MRRTVLALTAALVVLAGVQPAQAAARKPGRVGLVSFVAASYSRTTDRTSLTIDWKGVRRAKRYEVFVSTRYSMKRATRYTTRRSSRVLHGLRRGTDYFVQVRAVNGSAVGTKSWRQGHTTIRSQGGAGGQTYSVMTYNVCSVKCPGWGVRRGAVLERIQAYRPDVVAAQEATALQPPDGYTEAASKSAKRLFFKTSRFELATHDQQACQQRPAFDDRGQPVVDGAGKPVLKPICGELYTVPTADDIYLGHHQDGKRWAVWAELVDKRSHQHVFFVDVHTVMGKKGHGPDVQRRREIATLVRAIGRANPHHYPVVYAGDFNSHKHRPNDYMAPVFHAAGFYDAYDLAMRVKRQHFNTYNGFQKIAKTSITWGDHVDHVWVAPGRTRVLSWANVGQRSGRYYTSPIPSDHSPLLVRLRVR